MKPRIVDYLADIGQYAGQTLTVQGWVRTNRQSKSVAFIQLNDGSCVDSLQAVVGENTVGEPEALRAGVGCAVAVTGVLTATPGAQQPCELTAQSVTLIGACPPDYPLQKKGHSTEFLRTIAHLRPRTNLFSAAFRVRSEMAFAIHEFFHNNGFAYVHTPLITASDCEGAGEMFRVTTLPAVNPPLTEDGEVDFSQDFFGKPANLTVSGQLNGECFAQALGRIYTFGPTFRAEYSFTARHAAEFWMIEPEMAFCDLCEDMDVAEAMVKHILNALLARCPEELAFFDKWVQPGLLDRLRAVAAADFARCTYTQGIEILKSSGKQFEYPVEWGCDLQSEHERYLAEEHFGGPVFLTDYPKDIKAFYMRVNDDGKTVAATDLMVPGVGELIGGSQREEREDVLRARMAEMTLNPEDYKWYLDLRRYGSTPHAGFGLGFDRMMMYVTGIANIRDVVPFPRTTKNAEF